MKGCAINLLCLVFLGFGLSNLAKAAPANDSFSTPTVVSGLPAAATGSNIDATLQVNEPLPYAAGPPSNPYAGASVWFQWTPTISGAVKIDTLGSDFDTVIAIWTGSNITSLAEITSNDGYNGAQSAAFIDAVAGTTYHLAVYGYADNQGAISLSITNDAASRISGTVTAPNGTTPLAGIEAAAYRWNNFDSYWEFVNFIPTQADGSYTI